MVGSCCSKCVAPAAGCWGGVPVLRASMHWKHQSQRRCSVQTRWRCCSPIRASAASSSVRSSTGESARLRGGWETRSRSPTSLLVRPMQRLTLSPGRRRRQLTAETAVSTKRRRWHVLRPGRCGCLLRGCCDGSVQQRRRAPDGQRGWLVPDSAVVPMRKDVACCSWTTSSRPGPRWGRRPQRWRVPVLPPSMWQRVHDGVATALGQLPNMALPSFRAEPTELSTHSES